MSAALPTARSHLPLTRGRIRAQADLSGTNWFQVGGKAEYLFKPEDAEDLAHFLREKPADLPVTVIGVGSNLLVRDGGIDGVVIRLGRGFTAMTLASSPSPFQGEGRDEGSLIHTDGGDRGTDPHPNPLPGRERGYIQAGAACLDLHVARFAAEHGVAGLEFLSGIPGTIGGAVRMNAGAYGCDISQVLLEAEIVDAQGNIRCLSNEELGFTYRHSMLPEGAIVTRATLRGMPGDSMDILAAIRDIQDKRESTQPIRSRTGGSTFKNPEGHKAWELIDKAGCRGLTLGGAQVSEQHCNFLINTGNATAADLENLGEEVRRRVKELIGVELEWEIKRIGRHA